MFCPPRDSWHTIIIPPILQMGKMKLRELPKLLQELCDRGLNTIQISQPYSPSNYLEDTSNQTSRGGLMGFRCQQLREPPTNRQTGQSVHGTKTIQWCCKRVMLVSSVLPFFFFSPPSPVEILKLGTEGKERGNSDHSVPLGKHGQELTRVNAVTFDFKLFGIEIFRQAAQE